MQSIKHPVCICAVASTFSFSHMLYVFNFTMRMMKMCALYKLPNYYSIRAAECKIHRTLRTPKITTPKIVCNGFLFHTKMHIYIHFPRTMRCLRAFVELIKIVLNFKSVNIHFHRVLTLTLNFLVLVLVRSLSLELNWSEIIEQRDGKQQKCNFNARLIYSQS